MATIETNQYEGDGKLMGNYGWVQNTSNLSTVRDTVELVTEEGMNHNALMRSIYAYRVAKGDIKQKWTWDARCRIKAVCASGMVEIDRAKQGYHLTELGKKLCKAPKSNEFYRGIRKLTPGEKKLFQQGILTNPPVIRVLNLLNESRKNGKGAMSKYDVGGHLGFVGVAGFTHFEAEIVAQSGKSFNDAEGDADKWARTIISWLVQVGWVVKDGSRDIFGQNLPLFTTTLEVDKVLQYSVRSAIKYIPQEMLCSDHHKFTKIVQQRRVSILKMLSGKPYLSITEMLETMKALEIDIDEETLTADIVNLQQAGIQISKESPYYSLIDKINLDAIVDQPKPSHKKVDGIEKEIEHYIATYADSLPPRLVENLIRYSHDGTNSGTLFEMTVDKIFSHMGYDSQHLGQGHGRVADVLAKYRDKQYAKSYALIIDAKAYQKYPFPADDIRKMKEYISLHGGELLVDKIPRHAFAFISMAFSSPDKKLNEIAQDTAVSGTAIDVYTLMELGSKVAQKKVSISDIYSTFTTNSLYVCP